MIKCDDIESALAQAGFIVLGGFTPTADDLTPENTATLFLIGSAGASMWQHFSSERDPDTDGLDVWTRAKLEPSAEKLRAKAVFPFDTPPLPFQRWARKAGAGFTSPLGLNVHPRYGLWSAYRAALCFSEKIELPLIDATASPCETCTEKPCLTTCPVSAFDGQTYNVPACTSHLATPQGQDCMMGGCLARRACPVGQEFITPSEQTRFHMRAFFHARKS